ncbi:hypothetical protein SUGI_1122350 [Cryptomeria japonica]|nr:hypothetical protein SUGI_1122350 [Cryptomeria japonica]
MSRAPKWGGRRFDSLGRHLQCWRTKDDMLYSPHRSTQAMLPGTMHTILPRLSPAIGQRKVSKFCFHSSGFRRHRYLSLSFFFFSRIVIAIGITSAKWRRLSRGASLSYL